MNPTLIEVSGYLLAVDEKAEIKINDWYVDDANNIRKSIIDDPNYWDGRAIYHKLIAIQRDHPQAKEIGVPTFEVEETELGKFLNDNLSKSKKELFSQGGDEPFLMGWIAALMHVKVNLSVRSHRFSEEDMRHIVYQFLADGCPNFPKDSRGSWVKWCDNYFATLSRRELPVEWMEIFPETVEQVKEYERTDKLPIAPKTDSQHRLLTKSGELITVKK